VRRPCLVRSRAHSYLSYVALSLERFPQTALSLVTVTGDFVRLASVVFDSQSPDAIIEVPVTPRCLRKERGSATAEQECTP